MNYFSDNELMCKCGCGELKFSPKTRNRLNVLRADYGKPMIISSGYRCHEYNDKKGYTQTHATGHAVDVQINRKEAHKLLRLALSYGFTGIGIKQHGKNRYLHLDDLPPTETRLRPTIWSYK